MNARDAKIENRATKLAERLTGNRSRSAPDASRETRQQVRVEGRELEKQMSARAAQAARSLRQKNKPRRTESMAALFAAIMSAVPRLNTHDFGLSKDAKKEARKSRNALREAAKQEAEATVQAAFEAGMITPHEAMQYRAAA